MLISQLVNTLSKILNDYGNINVEIYYDPRESEKVNNDTQSVCIDNIKVIKIRPDNNGVYLSNEFIEYYEYKGCNTTVRYNPKTGDYYGEVIPQHHIEGCSTKFSTKNKFQIENAFHNAVDEYLDFLGNAQVKNTLNEVKNIIEENDLDYGELGSSDSN